MRSNRNFTSDERELTFPRLTIFPEFRYCKSVLDVQLLNHVQLCDPMDCRMPGFSVLHYFLELAQTHDHESLMPSNHLILCHTLLLPPSIIPSIRIFSNESVLHIRWPEYWSFSFSISSTNEYSRLISFRMDWLALLPVQVILKSLLQYYNSSKASILQCSAFFIVQLSHSYMASGKTIALTRWMFIGNVMSLLFNMLSRFVIAFLLRSKHLQISWLQSPSAVILEPKKNKVCHSFHCLPIYLV